MADIQGDKMLILHHVGLRFEIHSNVTSSDIRVGAVEPSEDGCQVYIIRRLWGERELLNSGVT